MSFDDKILNYISNCDYMEYDVSNQQLITNIPSNIKKIKFGNKFNTKIQPYFMNKLLC